MCFWDVRSPARWAALRAQENRQDPHAGIVPTPTACAVLGSSRAGGAGAVHIWDHPAAQGSVQPGHPTEMLDAACEQEPSVLTGTAQGPRLPLGICRQSCRKLRGAASAFAQQHDNPCTHFLHPCSQQDQTTSQQTPARPHCFDQPPWSDRAGSGFSLAVVTDACEISLGQAGKYSV